MAFTRRTAARKALLEEAGRNGKVERKAHTVDRNGRGMQCRRK